MELHENEVGLAQTRRPSWETSDLLRLRATVPCLTDVAPSRRRRRVQRAVFPPL